MNNVAIQGQVTLGGQVGLDTKKMPRAVRSACGRLLEMMLMNIN